MGDMWSARCIWLLGASVVIVCSLTPIAQAVTAQGQKDVLYQMRSQQSSLISLPIGPWTDAVIENACDPSVTLLGKVSCNATGWITELSFIRDHIGTIPAAIGDMQALTSLTAI